MSMGRRRRRPLGRRPRRQSPRSLPGDGSPQPLQPGLASIQAGVAVHRTSRTPWVHRAHRFVQLTLYGNVDALAQYLMKQGIEQRRDPAHESPLIS